MDGQRLVVVVNTAEEEKLEESENVAEKVVKKHVEKENTKPKEKIEYI